MLSLAGSMVLETGRNSDFGRLNTFIIYVCVSICFHLWEGIGLPEGCRFGMFFLKWFCLQLPPESCLQSRFG